MAFSRHLRRGTMLILAVTLFAVYGLHATANGNNPDPSPINNWAGFFPNVSIVSQFEISPYPVGPHGPVNDPTASAFQPAGGQHPLIAQWRLTIRRQFATINMIGAGSPFARQVEPFPIGQNIYKPNRDAELFLPITGDPSPLFTGYGGAPPSRIGVVSVPAARAAAVKATAKPSPIIKAGNEEITNRAAVEQPGGTAPSAPPAQPAVDAATLPTALTAARQVQATFEVPAIGGDAPVPTGGDPAPGGVNEGPQPYLGGLIETWIAQGYVTPDGRFAGTRPSFIRPAASNPVKDTVPQPTGSLPDGKTPKDNPVNPAGGPGEQPFVPLNPAGDRINLNSVSFKEQGKAFHKAQHKPAEVGFSLKPLTHNRPVSNNGGTHDIQRCSAQPRAPTNDQRNV